MAASDSLGRTLDALIHAFSAASAAGWRGYDCPDGALEVLRRWGSPATARRPAESLETIRDDLGDCRRCPLAPTRKHIVFGAGNPRARLVFVGEGPGQEEDLRGLPFVGAAGQLLTNIIAAMDLTRDDVYICNIVKCRPPRNRNPLPEEIEACLPFLKRQLAAIAPDFICALGSFAARTLLGSQEPISRLRGRFHDFGGVPVMPTYHPAYLLRNPGQKRAVWNDIQQLMKALSARRTPGGGAI